MFTDAILHTARARLLVCLTFQYVRERFRYLFETLRTLEEFCVDRLDVVVLTNTVASDELRSIVELTSLLARQGMTVEVQTFPHLAQPFDLTWCHKPLLQSRFLGRADYTHFVYLENDIRFSFRNFMYFLHFRDVLAQVGLLPSFVRVEYNRRHDHLCMTDLAGPDIITGRRIHRVGDLAFINVVNPYTAMYVLDQDLGAEYVTSRSFDYTASTEVTSWGVAERAAMGLCFERPPPGFHSRLAVPLHARRLVPESFAWVHHLPANYTNDDAPGPFHAWSKTRVDRAFACVAEQRLGSGYYTWTESLSGQR